MRHLIPLSAILISTMAAAEPADPIRLAATLSSIKVVGERRPSWGFDFSLLEVRSAPVQLSLLAQWESTRGLLPLRFAANGAFAGLALDARAPFQAGPVRLLPGLRLAAGVAELVGPRQANPAQVNYGDYVAPEGWLRHHPTATITPGIAAVVDAGPVAVLAEAGYRFEVTAGALEGPDLRGPSVSIGLIAPTAPSEAAGAPSWRIHAAYEQVQNAVHGGAVGRFGADWYWTHFRWGINAFGGLRNGLGTAIRIVPLGGAHILAPFIGGAVDAAVVAERELFGVGSVAAVTAGVEIHPAGAVSGVIFAAYEIDKTASNVERNSGRPESGAGFRVGLSLGVGR